MITLRLIPLVSKGKKTEVFGRFSIATSPAVAADPPPTTRQRGDSGQKGGVVETAATVDGRAEWGYSGGEWREKVTMVLAGRGDECHGSMIAPDLEASHARCFVQSSNRASIFSIWESNIRDLIDLTMYKTTQELWGAILKTFCRDEATKKTKKNQLKQQYGNFKAKGSETLEQTFNRLNDLDTLSLDDVYNNLKVQETEPTLAVEKGKLTLVVFQLPALKFPQLVLIFWKKTGKKITIQGTNVAGFDKLNVECFNYHKMGHFARECRAPRSQDRGRRENYKQGPKEVEMAPKALMAIDGVGWDWIYMDNEEENHALVADDEAPT
nr:hypothetical protein [Tanacetum cinerariifolium]